MSPLIALAPAPKAKFSALVALAPEKQDATEQWTSHKAVSQQRGGVCKIQVHCDDSNQEDYRPNQSAMDFQVRGNTEELEVKDMDHKIQ